MAEILAFTGAAADDASVLAHRLEVCVRGFFRLELMSVADEERRTHCDLEAVLLDARSRERQQRAVVECGAEKDIFRCRRRFSLR
jgi:hypothetical protein